jgi:hypothetical protein
MTLPHAPDDAAARERAAPAPDRLPTLTEVVELGHALALPSDSAELPLPPAQPLASDAPGTPVAMPLVQADGDAAALGAAQPAPQWPGQAGVDECALAARVLAALQPRIDALLEARLREAVAPALARAADALIRDAREELAAAMREVVAEAVARAVKSNEPH